MAYAASGPNQLASDDNSGHGQVHRIQKGIAKQRMGQSIMARQGRVHRGLAIRGT